MSTKKIIRHKKKQQSIHHSKKKIIYCNVPEELQTSHLLGKGYIQKSLEKTWNMKKKKQCITKINEVSIKKYKL